MEHIEPAVAGMVARARRPRKTRSPARTRAKATKRWLEEAERLSERFTLEELNEMAARTEAAADLVDARESSGRSVLTGESLPAAAKLERIALTNLQRSFAERQRLLQGTLTVPQVAALLGTRRQTPHDRLHAGRLVAIKDGGQWRFPLWQFDAEGPDGVVAGLPETVRALGDALPPLALIRWLVTPKPLLGRQTPIEALRQGRIDAVLAEARAAGAD